MAQRTNGNSKGSSKPQDKTSSRGWDGLIPGLSEWILDAVTTMGFTNMTPVQASTIPLFMGNKDVVVEAVTGSGKTLAFLIPVIERLLRLDEPIKRHHVGGIIISPTRELATQIYSVLLSLLAFHKPSAALLNPPAEDSDDEMADDTPLIDPHAPKIVPQLLLGGSTTPAQDLSLFLKNSPSLLIGTPGRLLELMSSPHVHCPQSSFNVLVLDEADRLLDLGFKQDVQGIISRLPKQRRTGLFSASVSEAVSELIRVGLRNPMRIAVKVRSASGKLDKRTPASLDMTYIALSPRQKIPAIAKIFTEMDPRPQKSILYLSTCAAVDYFSHIFPTLFPNVTTIPLHGKHPDKIRRKNFTRFSESVSPTLLLTTDLAARGLDIPTVDLVMQLDPPSDPKVFIHRCGRAGRAGRRGLSIVFLSEGREEDYIPFLEVRGTPITPYTSSASTVTDEEAAQVTSTIRRIAQSDRAIHDKAQKAFVSWVRSYSKHAARSIFRIRDLDWTALGDAWGLLRLPKMPELKEWSGDRALGLRMDWDTYSYKDRVREAKRVAELQAYREGAGRDQHRTKRTKTSSTVDDAWSMTKEKQEERVARRERRQTKRQKQKWDAMTVEEKEEARKLEGMIERVREQRRMEREEVFEGFDD